MIAITQYNLEQGLMCSLRNDFTRFEILKSLRLTTYITTQDQALNKGMFPFELGSLDSWRLFRLDLQAFVQL